MKFEIPRIECIIVGSNARRFGRRPRKARNLTKSPDLVDPPRGVDVKRTEYPYVAQTEKHTEIAVWPDASKICITFFHDI